MPHSTMIMRLNGFGIQNISKRGRRQNIFNELDSFVDDEFLQKIPQPPSKPAPIVPVVEQGRQAEPNNNQIVSTAKAPEPNNNQISGLLKQFQKRLGTGKRQIKFKDKKRSLKSKAEKGKTAKQITEAQLGKRLTNEEREVVNRLGTKEERLIFARRLLTERIEDPFRDF